jgi:tRNA (guanosine-2'-O-)-methyltransferase
MTRSLDSTGLKRLHREWRRRTPQRLALALDAVQGPFNVGAIVRTAAAMRVEHVWLLGEVPDLDADKVGKTALGTHRYLTWSRTDTPEALAEQVHVAGYSLLAVELAEPANPLHELDLRRDVCIVVGHEERGVRPGLLELCDQVGFVPQLGRVGSLNVATAAGIALYEVRRQHWMAVPS